MVPLSTMVVEYLASGALVALLGALIKYAGWTWLLAGYSESTSAVPDDVVRDMAGNTLMRVGVGVLLVGGLAAVTNPPAYLEPILAVAILAAVGRLLYRLNTYSPRTA